MPATPAPKFERRLWLGLSTDPKPLPTAPVGNLIPLPGDLFFCTDTSLCYVFDPQLNAWAAWPALSVVTGGGGGGGNVFVTNFPSVQTVDGTVTVVQSNAADLLATVTGAVSITGTPTVDVANFPATQPVSAASLPLPAGAATASGVAAVATALGQPMQQTGGSVAISGTPSVSVTNLPATQPVSGTVAATQSGSWSVSLNGQPIAISAASLPLPTGAATAAGVAAVVSALGTPMQQTGGSVSVSNLPATQPVSGTVSVGNFPATQPISAASLPLPTGAATNAELQTINTTLGAPLQAGGAVSVSNFPATQPVSIAAAVAVTQSGAWSVSINGQPVAISAAALPLPTGAATSAGQAAIIAALGSPLQETGGSVSIAGTPTVSVTNLPATQPVSGTVAVSNLPAEGQALSAASLPVVIASDQSSVPVSVASIALPPNAAQESGGNLDSIARLVYVNHLILAELRALRMMHAAVMTGAQIDPLTTLQDTVFN